MNREEGVDGRFRGHDERRTGGKCRRFGMWRGPVLDCFACARNDGVGAVGGVDA